MQPGKSNNVSRKYTICECPIILARELNNAKVRLALYQTGCYLDIQSRVLNWRFRATPWTKGSVLEVVGPTYDSVDECNTLIESVFPFYRFRKPYEEPVYTRNKVSTRECHARPVSEQNVHLNQLTSLDQELGGIAKSPIRAHTAAHLRKASALNEKNKSSCLKPLRPPSNTNVFDRSKIKPNQLAARNLSGERTLSLEHNKFGNHVDLPLLETAGDAATKDSNEHNTVGNGVTKWPTCGRRVLQTNCHHPSAPQTGDRTVLTCSGQHTIKPVYRNTKSNAIANHAPNRVSSRESSGKEMELSNGVSDLVHTARGDYLTRVAFGTTVPLKESGRHQAPVRSNKPLASNQKRDNESSSGGNMKPTFALPRTKTCWPQTKTAAVLSNNLIKSKTLANSVVPTGEKLGQPGLCLDQKDIQDMSGTQNVENPNSELFYACLAGTSATSDETVSTLPTTIMFPGHFRLSEIKADYTRPEQPDCSYGSLSMPENQNTIPPWLRMPDSTDKLSPIRSHSDRSQLSPVCSSSPKDTTEPIDSVNPTVQCKADVNHGGVPHRPLSAHSGQIQSESLLKTTELQHLPQSSCGDTSCPPNSFHNPVSCTIVPRTTTIEKVRTQYTAGISYTYGFPIENMHTMKAGQEHPCVQPVIQPLLEPVLKLNRIETNLESMEMRSQHCPKIVCNDAIIQYGLLPPTSDTKMQVTSRCCSGSSSGRPREHNVQQAASKKVVPAAESGKTNQRSRKTSTAMYNPMRKYSVQTTVTQKRLNYKTTTKVNQKSWVNSKECAATESRIVCNSTTVSASKRSRPKPGIETKKIQKSTAKKAGIQKNLAERGNKVSQQIPKKLLSFADSGGLKIPSSKRYPDKRDPNVCNSKIDQFTEHPAAISPNKITKQNIRITIPIDTVQTNFPPASDANVQRRFSEKNNVALMPSNLPRPRSTSARLFAQRALSSADTNDRSRRATEIQLEHIFSPSLNEYPGSCSVHETSSLKSLPASHLSTSSFPNLDCGTDSQVFLIDSSESVTSTTSELASNTLTATPRVLFPHEKRRNDFLDLNERATPEFKANELPVLCAHADWTTTDWTTDSLGLSCKIELSESSAVGQRPKRKTTKALWLIQRCIPWLLRFPK